MEILFWIGWVLMIAALVGFAYERGVRSGVEGMAEQLRNERETKR